MLAAIAPLTILMTTASGSRPDYDPLKIVSNFKPVKLDLTVHDAKRQRDIPLFVYLPESKEKAPVAMFSHGLGGTRGADEFLATHWAARGYVAVFMQHPGSDDSVWRSAPLLQRMSAMRKAASTENFMLRVNDVPALLDQLKEWNGQVGHPLKGRLDLEHIGMSGHSFGAVTTLAVSGQSYGAIGPRFTDARIKAAVAFSPNAPTEKVDPSVYSSVKIPWMLFTGTHDTAAVGNATVASRLAVYPSLPKTIDRYEIVLLNAEHSAFSDGALPGDRQKRNPNHHKVMLAFTTAFWDAYLRNDSAAKKWLQGSGAKAILEQGDRWQWAAGSSN